MSKFAEMPLTTSDVSRGSNNPETTIRYWASRNLLDHAKTPSGQRIFAPRAVDQAKALRAKRMR